MTTRDELHEWIDALPDDELEEAAAALRPLKPTVPASLGMGHSGRGDVAERADELCRRCR
ncbi:hypothetical protein [Streptomyces sp. NPDC050485]|uniref:hypothetical protein n=1 Tax=Streptomyces sp. NPDC050485 TaxID=3365617 RepID=UPI00379B8A22